MNAKVGTCIATFYIWPKNVKTFLLSYTTIQVGI
jgi:hypothetical protein